MTSGASNVPDFSPTGGVSPLLGDQSTGKVKSASQTQYSSSVGPSNQEKAADLSSPGRITSKPVLEIPIPQNMSKGDRDYIAALAKAFASSVTSIANSLQSNTSDFKATIKMSQTNIRISIDQATATVKQQQKMEHLVHRLQEKFKGIDALVKVLTYVLVAVTVIVLAVAIVAMAITPGAEEGGAGLALAAPEIIGSEAALAGATEGGAVAAAEGAALAEGSLGAEAATTGATAGAEAGSEGAALAADTAEASEVGATGSETAAGDTIEGATETTTTTGSTEGAGSTSEAAGDETAEETSRSAVGRFFAKWAASLSWKNVAIGMALGALTGLPQLIGGVTDIQKAEIQKKLSEAQREVGNMMRKLAEDKGFLQFWSTAEKRLSGIMKEQSEEIPANMKLFSDFNKNITASVDSAGRMA